MANKIDSIKIGPTTYDIDLPPDAVPSISGLNINGNLTVTGNSTLSTLYAQSIRSVDGYNKFVVNNTQGTGNSIYSVRGKDETKYNLDDIRKNFYIAYIAYKRNRKQRSTSYSGTVLNNQDYGTAITADINIQEDLQHVNVPVSYIRITATVKQEGGITEDSYSNFEYNNGSIKLYISLKRPRKPGKPIPSGDLSSHGMVYFYVDFAAPEGVNFKFDEPTYIN